MGSSHCLPKEIQLAGGNHITDTGDVIKHPADMFIVQMFFFHSEHGDAKYTSYVAMKEDLKFVGQHFPH